MSTQTVNNSRVGRVVRGMTGAMMSGIRFVLALVAIILVVTVSLFARLLRTIFITTYPR